MKRISMIVGLAVAFTAQVAFGQTTSWTNPAGGSANVPTNWSTGSVPTSSSSVQFNLPGPYTVSFSGPVQASTADVNAGEVTLDLGRQVFNAGSSVNIGSSTSGTVPSTAALVVQQGKLTSTGTLSVGRSGNPGTLTIRNGGIVEASQFRVEQDSIVTVAGAGSSLNFNSIASPSSSFTTNSQLLVTDGGVVLNNINAFASSPPLGAVSVHGAGSRIRNVYATTTHLDTGAMADYSMLPVIGGDFSADHSTVNATDLAIGSSQVGSSTSTGRMVLTASSLSVGTSSSAPLRIYAGSSLELYDGQILSTRTLTNDGTIRGSGRSTGQLDNSQTGSVIVGAGQRLSFEGRLSNLNSNRGLISVAGGELDFNAYLSNALYSSPSLVGRIVGRDATFHFGDGSQITGLSQSAGASLTLTGGVNNVFGSIYDNPGSKLIHTGNSQTFYYDDVVNNGSVQTSAGSTATFLNDVTGAGTFTGVGTVVFEGAVRPGNSPAVVAFGGDVVFAQGSNLVLEVAGADRGTQYDALNVAGNLELDGNISIQRLGGYVPLPGQTFDFLQAASFTGTPTIHNDTGLPGLKFASSTSGGGVTIEVNGLPGDANLDATVNFADLVTLAQHYNLSSGQTWLTGDFNQDAAVNFADLVALAQHYNQMAGLTSNAFSSSFAEDWALARSLVPEPIALLGLAASGIVAGRRRRAMR